MRSAAEVLLGGGGGAEDGNGGGGGGTAGERFLARLGGPSGLQQAYMYAQGMGIHASVGISMNMYGHCLPASLRSHSGSTTLLATPLPHPPLPHPPLLLRGVLSGMPAFRPLAASLQQQQHRHVNWRLSRLRLLAEGNLRRCSRDPPFIGVNDCMCVGGGLKKAVWSTARCAGGV